MKICLKACAVFLAFLFSTIIHASPCSIHIEDEQDYKVLDRFFKMGFSHEEYGYVLEGDKPISVRSFYSLRDFPITKDIKYAEKEFANSLLIQEVIPIWNRLCSHQKSFVLKATPLDGRSEAPTWEIQFINLSKLKEVIDKEINLFRYVLGPTLISQQLVDRIAYSKESFSDILKNDLVLIGIILGFETHNSLLGGRIEKISDLALSKDYPPFVQKSLLFKDDEDNSPGFLSTKSFGSYYLAFAGGDAAVFGEDLSPVKPSFGFVNVEEEMHALNAMQEPLPASLLNESPFFIFGAYKQDLSNQALFKRLQKTQKRTQALLKSPHFLESILKKIGGKKPVIRCKRSALAENPFSLFQNSNRQDWVKILRAVSSRFQTDQEKRRFVEALSEHLTTPRKPPEMAGASKEMLEGLKQARENLTKTDHYFAALAKESSLETVATDHLYFKTTAVGAGKKLQGSCRACMSYTIEDLEGNVLFADYKRWLDLSQTFLGFAHGVQEMCVGEKRTLFIHPTFAYGVFTTLPPCMGLVIHTHLIDLEEGPFGPLPSLTPLDLSVVHDQSFYQIIEESIQELPYFVGSFYHECLSKMGILDRAALVAELK